MRRRLTNRLLRDTVPLLLGVIALGLLTALCFWLDFRAISAAFAYLILIVLFSLTGGFLAPLVLSLLAVGCIAYFFAPPIFSFKVYNQEDIIAMIAFLLTSFTVGCLVRRMEVAKDALSNALHTIPALVWHTSSDGSALFLNKRFVEYTGFSSKELTGLGWMNALHPEDRSITQWRADLAAGKPIEKEVRVQNANIEYRWFILRMTPLSNERGTIMEWYGTASDIEDRKRAEQCLQRSEAYLADAQRISRTGSFAYDVGSGRLIHSSEEHHRLFGFDPAAGMPASAEWALRIHPDDREKAIDAMVQRLREQKDYEVDFRTVHPDGTAKYIHSMSHAVLSPSGDLVEIVGTSTDVTEQKRAEYLIGQVFDRSPDLVGILGRDYRYRRGNATYEKWRGIAPEKLIGMHIRDVVGKKMFNRLVKPNLERCFAGEEASFADWFDTHGGHKYWLMTYSPLRLDSERIEAVLIIGRDLTEYMLASERLRDAQAQLAHANRVSTMGQLTVSIAHEVNQPIGALVTNARAALRLLRNDPPDMVVACEALDDIIKDGERASEVIARIRALIKRSPPQADVLDINKVTVETIALIRGEIQRSAISLETQLGIDLPPVRGDRVQLQQVIMNLLMNAVEAMNDLDEGTRELWIGTSRDEGNHILLTVRDTGPSLTPRYLDRFFEAFYSTKPNGMGIGLSICRSIVEAHGGRIWATANIPQGAILRITLPAVRETVI